MTTAARRTLIFVVLVVVAIVAGQFGRMGWFAAFVENRTFSEPFGILDWASLISWCFEFLFFFAFGVVIASLFSSNHPLRWSFAFGGICGALRFSWSHYHFYSEANWATYFWAYGSSFMPALGALAGAKAAQLLSAWRIRHATIFPAK